VRPFFSILESSSEIRQDSDEGDCATYGRQNALRASTDDLPTSSAPVHRADDAPSVPTSGNETPRT
jgi:hypothetical protein